MEGEKEMKPFDLEAAKRGEPVQTRGNLIITAIMADLLKLK